MSTCKAVVLAVILALCTGISRGQCPATCQCYGTVRRMQRTTAVDHTPFPTGRYHYLVSTGTMYQLLCVL
ncbi:hypothetical protein DPMN_192134 [Dreissena polymorpha]|uniref:Uncharacterized protein n=1 Tax=Dreissena polymorpha TaxID=45954 RepID=A0A9D4BCM3_DREPO|nr:hypothetical protein DPMN_192134 [Dreissena polymorpha]